MLSSTFTLKADSFSRLFVSPGKSGKLRRYYSVVPISEIPFAWSGWLDVNARDSTAKGRVPQAIRRTLLDQPEWFAEYNRGLTLVASKIEWNNKTKSLTVEFEDRQYNGVLDGGHTLRVILDGRVDDVVQEGYCNVEIFTGLEQDEITNVVDARNTSKQVASKSLLNLEGRFEKLKEAIGPDKAELISWKENEDGAIDVREFIGMLTALDAGSFSGNSHPLKAYSGKEACLKLFESKSKQQAYSKLLKIAPDILEIWDTLQYCLPEQYNSRNGGKFGKLSGVKTLSANKKRELPFIGKTTKYDIPTGYIYPLLASFRAMLTEENGFWTWGKGLDPIVLIREEELATDVFLSSVRDSIDNYRNANRTGKDVQAWTAAYLVAENYYLRKS